MAENKTKPTDASVEDYILSRASEQQRTDCHELMALLERVTEHSPKMWGPSIVGFGSQRFKYASGRELDWPLAAFSPRKKDLTVYLIPGFERYDDLMKSLGKHSTGKSCLYIKRLSDIDLKVLQTLVEDSVKRGQEGRWPA